MRTLFSALALAALFLACSSDPESGEHEHSERHETERGEHDRENGEHGGEHGGRGHSEEGEESGTELALDETYDRVRNGARLVLAYDAATNSFGGTVENTTAKALERVRVEVHLSSGRELGPTAPADLAPGEKRAIELAAESRGFDGWTAHPEVGRGEHGDGEVRDEND